MRALLSLLAVSSIAVACGAPQQPSRSSVEEPIAREPEKSKVTGAVRCGGGSTAQCPAGSGCIDDPSDACDKKALGDCPGLCVSMSCGSGGKGCDPGFECTDDASDACDPIKEPGCRGTCTEVKYATCGGFDHKSCPAGLHCLDDATDGCNPSNGGDCPGICMPK